MTAYQQINRASWDERAPAHAASPEYAVDSFARDPEHLSNVVRFDVPRLGSVEGLRGVHLQCHIGTDTVSLSRLGARMTGVDFSPTAVLEARKLAAAAEADVDFVESDVYAAREALGTEMFDLVFTGIGALCWLPDIARWAEVVRSLLKPGGRLFLREGHPMMWTARRHRRRRGTQARAPVLRARRADGVARRGHLRHDRRRVHAERDARVEPRARRAGHRPARARASS
jgi:SAM-dependent methyltransferase